MALAAARSTIKKTIGVKSLLGKHVSVTAPIQIQVAYLQAMHGDKYPYLKAWPYETKKFNVFHETFDYSADRIGEQSKVIVVEGNVGSGKNEFARRLAWNFDMKYFPGVTEDDLFTSFEGFDYRSVDDMLPEQSRCYTISKFVQDANLETGASGNLQMMFYIQRYYAYAKALQHLLNTGQGVVVVRSPFSDRVFLEAMRRMGWLKKNFIKYYDDLADNSHCVMWKPHVNIFLDTPVNVCMENIKKRARANEKNPRNLNEKFLNMVESIYRESYLPRSSINSEVVEIDWREVGDDMDMEVIAEEIAGLDLEVHDNDDPKFDDWKNLTEDKVGYHRKLYGCDWQLTHLVNRDIPFNCPEIRLSDEDRTFREKIITEHPGLKYEKGWRPEFGDNVLFKMW